MRNRDRLLDIMQFKCSIILIMFIPIGLWADIATTKFNRMSVSTYEHCRWDSGIEAWKKISDGDAEAEETLVYDVDTRKIYEIGITWYGGRKRY